MYYKLMQRSKRFDSLVDILKEDAVMPRPCKRRRICEIPACERFVPSGKRTGNDIVVMTLDEYESIRLIDLECMTQEQCAEIGRAHV